MNESQLENIGAKTVTANPKRTFGNSRKVNAAIWAGALAFLTALGFVAFGGTDSTPAAAVVTAEEQPVEAPAAPPLSVDPPAAPAADEAESPVEDSTDEADVEDTPVEAETPVEAGTPAPAASPSDEEAEAEATEDAVEDIAPVADRPIGPDSPPAPPGAPQNYSISSGGKLYLRGIIPSVETETGLVTALAQIIGPDNVISEFRFDPDIPYTPGAPVPVFIDEKVLFESGSAVIAPAFYPIIAGMPAMQQIQPTVVVTIFGFTDSVGDADRNLELSQQRVDAARDWIISQGGDGSRLIAIGKGEADPVADNDTEVGRSQNRRIEFLVEGFQAAPSS